MESASKMRIVKHSITESQKQMDGYEGIQNYKTLTKSSASYVWFYCSFNQLVIIITSQWWVLSHAMNPLLHSSFLLLRKIQSFYFPTLTTLSLTAEAYIRANKQTNANLRAQHTHVHVHMLSNTTHDANENQHRRSFIHSFIIIYKEH